MVHHEREAHFALPHHGIQEKLAKLVLNGRDGFAAEPLIVTHKFLGPKFPDEGVFDLPHEPRAIGVICEQAIEPSKVVFSQSSNAAMVL